MANFEIYVFILCLIVFIMLTAVFSYLIAVIFKQDMRLIRAGMEDDAILKAYTQEKDKNKTIKYVEMILSVLICAVLIIVFVFSAYVNVKENNFAKGVSSLKVVSSTSMASKNESNDYLFENNINNQIGMYDLIVMHPIPTEQELKLYDVVAYKIDGTIVLHRIVSIEEPNDAHPNQRYFMCQGDALSNPDRYPVLYSQMCGIYKGEKIPMLGHFVMFMQSPAGWLCILLTVFVVVVTPVMEKKLKAEENKRLEVIGVANKRADKMVWTK